MYQYTSLIFVARLDKVVVAFDPRGFSYFGFLGTFWNKSGVVFCVHIPTPVGRSCFHSIVFPVSCRSNKKNRMYQLKNTVSCTRIV